jgi:hypothetical protein
LGDSSPSTASPRRVWVQLLRGGCHSGHLVGKNVERSRGARRLQAPTVSARALVRREACVDAQQAAAKSGRRLGEPFRALPRRLELLWIGGARRLCGLLTGSASLACNKRSASSFRPSFSGGNRVSRRLDG